MIFLNSEHSPTLPENITIALAQTTELDGSDLILQDKTERPQSANQRREREFTASRSLIQVLVEKTGLDSRHFVIKKDEQGKPFGLYNDRQFYLGIAHSGDKVLCGLSGVQEFGIDLEPIDRKVARGLRSRITTDQEHRTLQDISTARIWTLKESYAKLKGLGIKMGLHDIHINQEQNGEFVGRYKGGFAADIISFKQQMYWLAVATYR